MQQLKLIKCSTRLLKKFRTGDGSSARSLKLECNSYSMCICAQQIAISLGRKYYS